MDDLLAPEPTHLPDVDARVRGDLESGVRADEAAARTPTSSLAWAVLAEGALATDEPVAAYAYARTGYHRGLDALRRAGWRGRGAVPVGHGPNQGFLRALLALAEAAAAIGEDDEAERCRTFLVDCGTSADEVAALR
ncbi:DUF3151 domain-containing protein [Cellulomonas sp. APG4]|uniref:DUF3151 domain-containing protein n=1 Tax=Cellulomonas sp. APG4 TaxID=1538656 RepID=UPI00137A0AFA|nr:DUF3151 domain-containing protein [Cellulomonas sp. APG4]NCT90331.1 DUF3151 domain-containing protein [Cellulomonas sp. APG4]